MLGKFHEVGIKTDLTVPASIAWNWFFAVGILGGLYLALTYRKHK